MSSQPDPPLECAWASHFDACTLPGGDLPDALTLSQPARVQFDTNAGVFSIVVPQGTFITRTMQQVDGGPDVLVLYTSAFRLAAGVTLDVTGDKPLVIAADSTIAIEGTLNAGSQTGPPLNRGPGANRSACTQGLDGAITGDGGGGGGGALAAVGGAGGDGDSDNGGRSGAFVAIPAFIRGGCPGGAGGRNGGGAGGSGGGAIELAARGSIVVSGSINAGGGGGEAGGRGRQGGGGGGGGSGGVISLDSPKVTLAASARVAANGGGGGGGADNNSNATAGGDGAIVATGAAGGTSAIDHVGGTGGSTSPLGGGPGIGDAEENGGGGGGGGSSGYVMVRAGSFVATGAVVSPAAASQP